MNSGPDTDTADHIATALQVAQLCAQGRLRAGAHHGQQAEHHPGAVPKIVEQLAKMNVGVPLIGDFHFNGHKLLADNPVCAELLANSW